MIALTYRVTFHTWFRVGAELGASGVDIAVDRTDPLPGSSLKGVMRAAAVELFGEHQTVIAAFGSTSRPSPWTWSSAVPGTDGWTFDTAYRVRIDSETGTAMKDFLVNGDQAWAKEATFSIRQIAPLDPSQADQQRVVLDAAAMAVHHLGGWRRRGLGWVGIEPVDSTPLDLTAVMALQRRHE